jgi:hypothetical protein
MNKAKIPESDLDRLLSQALKDDLAPEAEARMNNQFLRFKHALVNPKPQSRSDPWLWINRPFRKEIFAAASAAIMILGLVLQLAGSQNVFAHTIEQLKLIVTVSASLNRVVHLDCTISKPGPDGETTTYHLLWRANGDARLDMVSAGGEQTIWISDETISFAGSDGGSIHSMPLKTIAPGPVWEPAMEFRTPALLAKHMEERYGLMQSGEGVGAGSDEFLITGRDGGQAVEISVDARTYLPKVLKKFAANSSGTNGNRVCLMEARFFWNQPVSEELFVPGPLAGTGTSR